MEKARGFEHPYENFVWRELSIIRELERNGEYYQALLFVASLLKYLQPEVRRKQEQQAKDILVKVSQIVRRTAGSNYFVSMQAKNRVAAQLGQTYLDEVITQLSNQLGDRKYMEKGASAYPQRPSKDRMKVPEY